jgi:hypothetical protein
VRDQFGEKGDWEKFLVLFNARFLPEPVLRQKEEEFNKLVQGSMPVWEYHAEFMTLARYAPHLLNDEVRLARKFWDGLRFEIIRRIGDVPVDTVAKIVEVAQNAEIDANREKVVRPPGDAKGKGKMHTGSSKWRKRKAGGGSSEGTQATLSGEGQPRKQQKTVECYNCHELGHIRSRCPHRRQSGQGQAVQPVQMVQPAPQGQYQMQYRPAVPAPPVQQQSQLQRYQQM